MQGIVSLGTLEKFEIKIMRLIPAGHDRYKNLYKTLAPDWNSVDFNLTVHPINVLFTKFTL